MILQQGKNTAEEKNERTRQKKKKIKDVKNIKENRTYKHQH